MNSVGSRPWDPVLYLSLSWESSILHSSSAQEIGRVGRSGLPTPLQLCEALGLCLTWCPCSLSLAALPDKSSGLRKALGGCGDCRWLRLRNGLLTATVGVLPKFIPAVDMSVKEFQSLLHWKDWDLSRATKVAGLLGSMQKWKKQIPAGLWPWTWRSHGGRARL